MDQDQEQLRLLSIFHYVVAGSVGLLGSCGFLHLIAGIGGVSGLIPETTELSLTFAWVLIGAGTFFILTGWALAACVVVAGRSLTRHNYYAYCLVVAAIECLFIPFGTMLGVFAIIVLVRPSVRRLFEAEGGSVA